MSSSRSLRSPSKSQRISSLRPRRRAGISDAFLGVFCRGGRGGVGGWGVGWGKSDQRQIRLRRVEGKPTRHPLQDGLGHVIRSILHSFSGGRKKTPPMVNMLGVLSAKGGFSFPGVPLGTLLGWTSQRSFGTSEGTWTVRVAQWIPCSLWEPTT